MRAVPVLPALDADLNTAVWIGIGLAVVLIYLLVMRVFFRESKKAVERIDYSKVREWKDDPD